MSCKQVLYVHLYSTDNYVFSCCVLLLVFENFVLLILLCFLCLLNMIVLNSFTEHILYKFIQKCLNNLYIYLTLIDKPNAKNQSVFPVRSSGGRRIRKSLVFGQVPGLFKLLPTLPSLTRPPATQANEDHSTLTNLIIQR